MIIRSQHITDCELAQEILLEAWAVFSELM
jgi:hypothetical protein